jgi:hypothetical protein
MSIGKKKFVKPWRKLAALSFLFFYIHVSLQPNQQGL